MEKVLYLIVSLITVACCQVTIDGPGTVNAHVYENSDLGTEVVDFHALGNSIVWSLNSTNNFTINSAGLVSVAGNLDREAIPAPHLMTLIVTATSGSFSDSVVLVVSILDRNDNAPLFENPTSNGTHDNITLLESEPVGSIVYTILAADPDYSSGGNFHFILSYPDGYFTIGYLTGDIELNKQLDYEQNTMHTLSIHIVDEGSPPLTSTITITVNVTNENEEACTFSQKFYHASIPEGYYSPLTPSTISTVSASDPAASFGAQIRYYLTTNPSNLFSIGLTNGIIVLSGSLDRETTSRYIVSLSAQEFLPNGNIADSPPCSATLVLRVTDINDNPPTFYSGTYSSTVRENVELGHIAVATVDAFDIDEASNAVFSYRIRDTTLTTFQIHQTTGVINVTGPLDYESGIINYQFIIEAYEPNTVVDPKTGTATVTVHVEDVNDNTPYFLASNYSYTIYEEQPASFLSPLLRAEDDDATSSFNMLSFSISGFGASSPNKHFQVTSAGTDVAQFSSAVLLDRESTSFYHMIATVSDNGPSPLTNTASIFVTILDINDHAPTFDVTDYSIDLVEETTYFSCIAVHAEDTMDEPGPNTQVFYHLTIHSSSPNTSLSYLQNKFILDSGTGEMSCLAINHEYGYHDIVLKVTATDAGTNPGPLNSSVFINVTIEDINEHPPVFTQVTYNTTIYENHTVGDIIGITVVATETGDDGLNHPLTYSIVSGNINGAFSLDPDTGIFALAHSIDYETLSVNPISIKVRASDRYDQGNRVHTATATVLVHVLDINDNSPYIISPLGHPTFSVSEGDLPRIITIIQATDPDGNSDGTVTYDFTHPLYGNFSMDTPGVLFMNSPPDREIVPLDTFTIALTARDQPPNPSTARTNSTYIHIVVTDINDHPPVFLNKSLSATIPEDTPGAVSLVQVMAEDNFDLGINAEIEYFIESVSPFVINPGGASKFQVDQSTGILQTGSVGFDYEDHSDRFYTIIIVARDKGTNPMRLTDTATITVTITDVNDNAPILTGSFFSKTIPEDYGQTLTNSDTLLIAGINYTDIDTVNGNFLYSIVDPLKTLGLFDIDPNNGEIYIPSGTNIDREDTDNVIDSFGRAVITFVIQLTDGLYFDQAEITIYITDVNDQSPVFAVTSISTGVPENVPIGTVVDVIAAFDSDYGTNAVITYAKSSGDPQGLFSVPDDSVGKIVVSGILDKENGPPNGLYVISFYVTATDSAGHNDSVQVMVEITDTNDNSPIFSPTFYQVTISEAATFDDVLENVNATDDDTGSNGLISYSIVGGNVQNAFYIKHSDVGDVRVFNVSAIDRETLSFYRLIIQATDGAFPASYRRTAHAEFVIHISDINDNTPEFLHFLHKGTIQENVVNNTFVAVTPSVFATDRDIGTNAIIIYDIEAGHPFRIDSNTGFIYTSDVGVLDREIREFYNLTVHARDKGGRETIGILQINISDVNDNAPIIHQNPLDLDISVYENYTIGGHIASITASDDDIGVNSRIRYSLTGGEGYFQIDANTGNVTLVQSLLPIEHRSDFTITVTVHDGGIPSFSDSVSFRVSVKDVNDNHPVFNHQPATFTRREDVTPNIILPLDPGLWTPSVVTDDDEGINAEYDFFLAANSSSVFSFDNTTGHLRLVQHLDYEKHILHTGLIYVKDRGVPSLQAVNALSIRLIVTDANDQPPVFVSNYYSINVSESTQSNVPLHLVSATDNDTAPFAVITYHIISSVPGSGHDLFKIDESSGLVLTKNVLDVSTKGCYTLTVEARNPDSPLLNDNATIFICITDQNESPQFDQSFYNFSIYENEPSGYVLGSVFASDSNDEGNNAVIVYSLITDPSDLGYFSMDSATGVLTTLAPLDREEQDFHILTVIAQDMGQGSLQHTNYTTIIVNVLDVNDNRPQFLHNTYDKQYTISEGIARNTTITTVEATDVDLANINLFDIIYDPRNLFKIDHQTGLLQTEGGPDDFDRETFSNYTITIEVYNVDNVTLNNNASIIFYLTDVNDNGPYFVATANDTCVYENTPPGLLIGTYVADDADIGINAKVFFQITSGNVLDAFSVEALGGRLKLLNTLDYETGPLEYTLTIEVRDLGTPHFSAQTDVTICVLDVNDNGPLFVDDAPDPVSVVEGVPDGLVLYSFDVTDNDSPPYNEANLQLLSGNDLEAFYFNESTQELVIGNGSILDYESGDTTFTLTILAVDNDNPQFNDTVSVTISITDANDNPPVLSKTEFNTTLYESQAISNTLLGQVTGTDRDSGVNAELHYFIVEGDTNTFSIDANTGVFILSRSLDYETDLHFYNVTVKVTDGGVPSMTAMAYFYLYILDENDNPPVIIDPNPGALTVISIPENQPIGYVLICVNVTDIDGGIIHYNFSNGLTQLGSPPIFKIQNTGCVILEGSLDRETKDSYEVTLVAYDKDKPSFQDSFHFRVFVTDVNDHKPSFRTPLFLNYYLPEDHPIGPDYYFTYLNGTDVDISDADNLYYYAVIGNQLSNSDCDRVFCVQRNGRIYHHRRLDREIEAFHTLTVAISNFPSLTPTNKTVQELNIETLTLTIIVTDVNDNSPQFLNFETKIGISDDEAFGTKLLTILTTDADIGNFKKVWYRIQTGGAAIVINKETGVITTAGSFTGEAGRRYTSQVEAYDNEGVTPSNSNFKSLILYVYNYQENSVILQLNHSVEYITNNIEEYTRALENATGNQVVITEVRVNVNPTTGQVDNSKSDVVFIVIDNESGEPSKGSDVVSNLNDPTRNLTLPEILVQESPTITVPLPPIVNSEGYPLWVLILIIVGLGAVVLLLCCAFCAFLINEKRRNRKLIESRSEISDDAFSMTKTSSEFNTTSNPLWVSPVLMPPPLLDDDDSTSITSVNVNRPVVQKPNPMYEDQEVNLELFDDDDDTPPISSTENLIRPPASSSTLRGGTSLTEDELLDQAVGLTPLGSNHGWDDDDNDDDKFSFI